MLRCPERHEEGFLVLSTGEMLGRMVRSGMLGCPVCGKEYPIVRGVAHFSGGGMRDAGSVAAGEPTHLASRISHPADVQTLQALLDLSGPGGYVLLLGSAAQHAVGSASAYAWSITSLWFFSTWRRLTLSDGVSSPDSIVKSRSIRTTFFGISNLARSRRPPITSRSILAWTSASRMSSPWDA